jgi:FeS assembly SUF system protein
MTNHTFLPFTHYKSRIRAFQEPFMDTSPFKTLDIESSVIEALQTIYDPEIPVNIYELGLIYTVDVMPSGEVAIRMTLTSPACPVAGSLPPEVEQKVREVPGVTDATVEVVWDPPWNPEMMSEASKLELGFF